MSACARSGRHARRPDPVDASSTRVERFGTLSWTTMPEQLQARGISWKVYGDPDGNYGDNVLPYFKQYQTNPTLAANALDADLSRPTSRPTCAAGTLPQVSWVLAPLIAERAPAGADVSYGEVVARAGPEHARLEPVAVGEDGAVRHLRRERRLLRPRAAARRAGRDRRRVPDGRTRCRATPAGVAGPIGLGFRVPMLVVSPFARGGFVCSRHVRPHLAAALPRDPVRRRGARTCRRGGARSPAI